MMVSAVLITFLLAIFSISVAESVVLRFGSTMHVAAPHMSDFGMSQYQQLGGLVAALKELNEKGELPPDVTVELSVRHTDPLFGVGYLEAQDLVETQQILAFVSTNYFTTPAVIQYVGNKSIALVGSISADPTALFNSPTFINYRFSFVAETVESINYAFNSELQCSRFGVLYYENPAVKLFSDSAISILSEFHITPLSQPFGNSFMMGNYSILDEFFKDADKVPQCFLLYAPEEAIVPIVAGFRQHPQCDHRNTYFFGVSVANRPSYTVNGDASIFENLFVTQQFPDASDDSFVVITRYQNALRELQLTNTPLFPGVDPIPELTHNYYSLEGYIVGRMVAEAVKKLVYSSKPITRQNFLDVYYDSMFLSIDDLVVGPFVKQCFGQSSLSGMPCFCNSGNKIVYVSRVDSATGLLHGVHDNASLGETGVAYLSVPLTSCGLSAKEIIRPHLFLQLVDSSLDQSTLQGYATSVFSSTLTNALLTMNNHSTLVGDAKVKLLNRAMPFTDSDILENIKFLEWRYQMLGFLGGSVTPHTLRAANISVTSIGWYSGVLPLSDPAHWFANDIALDPVLADYIHALASFVSSTSPPVQRIIIIASSPEERALAQLSVHTFQCRFERSIIVSSPADVIAELKKFNSTAASSGSPVVSFFVASQNLQIVREVVLSGGTLQQSNIRFLLATSEEILHDVITNSLPPSVNASKFFFASVLSAWWRQTVRSELQAAFYLVNGPSAELPHPAALKSIRVAAVLMDVVNTFAVRGTPEKLVSAFFTQGTFSILDFSVGPFSDAMCHESINTATDRERTCQCGKGPRRFLIHNLLDWRDRRSVSATGDFSYVLQSCGVVYKPLVETVKHTTTIVAVSVTSALFVIIVAAVLIRVLTLPKRDNSAAPKKDNEPFVIVFTDIQSSTALWSRIPEVMSGAVDKHHSEIRKLVTKFEGYEVKTIGDSFMVAFAAARSAVKFSLALQKEFSEKVSWDDNGAIGDTYANLAEERGDSVSSSEPWNGLRVRVGIHFGYGNIRLDPVSLGYDYYGTVVNTAARVEGVGHGGQVLVTSSVYQQLLENGAISFPCDVADLGDQPLRGLEEPVHLYQLLPQELRHRKFPPLRLDIERTTEEEIEDPDGAQSAVSSAHTASQYQVSSVEAFADRFAKRSAAVMDPTKARVLFTEHFLFTKTLFSTSDDKYRRQLINHLAQQWKVPLKKGSKRFTKVEYEHGLGDVLQKVLPAASQEYLGAAQELSPNLKDRRLSSKVSLGNTPRGTGSHGGVRTTSPKRMLSPRTVPMHRVPTEDTSLGEGSVRYDEQPQPDTNVL